MKKIFFLVIKTTIPVMLVLYVYNMFFLIGKTASSSMEGEIPKASYTITNKLAYVNKNPSRGDIIVFNDATGDQTMKRIIGLPEETIKFVDGYVYVNEKRLDESMYLDEEGNTYSSETFKVPENSYLVLGDNRLDSYDSRFMKESFVSKDNIVGRVIYCFVNVKNSYPVYRMKEL